MEQEKMKKCPYCAEMIKAEAIKCRFCKSDLRNRGFNMDFLTAPGYWQRVNDGKKIAGVCTGIARQLDSQILIMPLRLFFIVTTLFYGFGIILYIVLWLLMPAPTDTPGMAHEPAGPGAGSENVGEPPQPDDAEEESGSYDELTITDETDTAEHEPSGTDDAQEPPKDTSVSQRRKMDPIIGIATLVIGFICGLGMYIAVVERFIRIIMPPWLMFVCLATVTGITVLAVRELGLRKQAMRIENV